MASATPGVARTRERTARALIVLAVAFAVAAPATGVGDMQCPKMEDRGRLSGRLLVATERLRDPRFQRTVIYMLRHDDDGAMGLVVNRPVGDVLLAQLLGGLGRNTAGVSGTIRVHLGGPVQPGVALVLHTKDWTVAESQVIRDGIALTRDPAILDAIAHGTGPKRSLLALGYAGWAPGQIEAEIARGDWVTVVGDEALLFDEEAATKWERAMARRPMTL
jgi:putative transcriptional regulator